MNADNRCGKGLQAGYLLGPETWIKIIFLNIATLNLADNRVRILAMFANAKSAILTLRKFRIFLGL
jgi:hypothetical protein